MDTKLLDCTGLQMVMRKTQRAVAYIALVRSWLVGTIVLHIAANTALLQQLAYTAAPAACTAAVPLGTAAVLLGIAAHTVVVVCAALQVAELMNTAATTSSSTMLSLNSMTQNIQNTGPDFVYCIGCFVYCSLYCLVQALKTDSDLSVFHHHPDGLGDGGDVKFLAYSLPNGDALGYQDRTHGDGSEHTCLLLLVKHD